MSKKKIGIIVAVVVIIAAAAGGGAWYLLNGNIRIGNSADKVYVEKVSTLNSVNSGVQNRYSGVVEAQESWKVNKDMEREVKEVFVEEGDMVEEGDSLFEYNMDDVESEISQGELELEGLQNEITDLKSQITQLTQERNSAPSDEKFQYTAEIQEKENSIKQTEYNIESKKAEMEKKQESIDNAVVTSKIAGVVKSINESGGSAYDSEEDSAYMTVLAVGDYRVKGTVSESNVQMLSEEQQVILRSRIDEDQTWTGTITKIDTQNESTDSSNDMYMYDSGGSSEKATKYPFYITLDDTDGLMMGQHLFIELDEGQTEEKEGIWLFEGYIVREDADAETEDGADAEDIDMDESAESIDMDEDAESIDMDEDAESIDMDEDAESIDMDEDAESIDMDEDAESIDMDEDAEDEDAEEPGTQTAYVWAANDRNKLEKRQVELGEYDEVMGEYEILSGLTEDDYIAFPMDGLYEGITTVTSIEDVDYTSPLYNQGEDGDELEDGEISEDGEMIDGGEMFNEEGFDIDDETIDEDMSDEDDMFDEDDMLDEDMSDEEDMFDEDDASGDDELSGSESLIRGNDADLGGFEMLQ